MQTKEEAILKCYSVLLNSVEKSIQIQFDTEESSVRILLQVVRVHPYENPGCFEILLTGVIEYDIYGTSELAGMQLSEVKLLDVDHGVYLSLDPDMSQSGVCDSDQCFVHASKVSLRTLHEHQ